MWTSRRETALAIARTPYTLVLLYLLAATSDSDVHLFVDPWFDDDIADALVASLTESDHPFTTIQTLPGIYRDGRKRPMSEQRPVIRRNVRTVVEFAKSTPLDTVYVTSDRKEVDQAAMAYARRANPDVRCVYVEDGSEIYGTFVDHWSLYPTRLLNRLVCRTLFGFRWDPIEVYGTSRYVDEIRALYPEQLRPELRGKPASSISKAGIQRLRGSGWIERYVARFGVTPDDLRGVNAIFALPHSLELKKNPTYNAAVDGLIETLLDRGFDLAIKAHPRDRTPQGIDLDSFPGVVVPSQIPMEFVYLLAGESVEYVFGDMTTSLYTAKWLDDRIRSISFANVVDHPDARLLGMFRAVGVEPFDGFDALDGRVAARSS